jgi:trk system potassium uptake protein TrkA
MKVIVVGCGRVGSGLAYRLFGKGHKVTVLDAAAEAFVNLPADFRGRTVHGEALHHNVLARAGIEEADGLAAVTNSDSLNAVVARVAHDIYRVPRVVVRNYDPRWRSLHEAMGLQVVSSASWGAQRIEELLYQSHIRTVYSAGNGEVEVYELVVPEPWHGRCLADLLPEGHCRPVALTRAGQATLPLSDACLESGDVVLLSATLDGIELLRERVPGPGEG